MNVSYDFSGRVVLVTGAAEGIGAETAMTFAHAGAKVVAADIDAVKVEAIAAAINADGGSALALITDVSDSSSVADMVAESVKQFGRIDYAFNNAGVLGAYATITECRDEDWDRVISVNLSGVFYCLKHQLRQMREQGSGAIVNMSSTAGLVGYDAKLPAYSPSKHGVLGLTRTAALENAGWGIRVNAVCPGDIDTPMQEKYADLIGDGADTSALVPAEELGKARDVASAVMWLCSDGADFVNGHALAVDNGYTAQ